VADAELGSINTICNLIASTEALRDYLAALKEPVRGDSYPLAEFWCQIFDDGRLSEVVEKTAVSYGMSQKATSAFEQLFEVMNSLADVALLRRGDAKKIVEALSEVLSETEAWKTLHCSRNPWK
jgi:hypothetical protein